MDLKRLSDEILITQLKALASEERSSLRAFLQHLVEFEERDLAQKNAFPSVYLYCIKELHLSEGEAFRRIQTAHVAARFPWALDLLESGKLNLTTISVLAPHLDKSNVDRLFTEAAYKSKRETEFIVAGLAPKPEPRDLIRLCAEPTSASQSAASAPTAPISASSPLPDRIEPLTERSARIAFTASRLLLDKLERARELLRHKHPKGELHVVFDEALESLLNKCDPNRKKRMAPISFAQPGRRQIPQWVKDEVWRRDSGRCAFTTVNGARCEETAWLEYDHIHPFARGGRSDDPANVRLLCRAHNLWTARQVFGEHQRS